MSVSNTRLGRMANQSDIDLSGVGEAVPRVAVDGKHLSLRGRPFRVHGVTYGSFSARLDGELFPDRTQIKKDFVEMAAAGFNVVRTYTLPTEDLIDIAAELEMKVLVGVNYQDWRYEVHPGRDSQRRIRDAGMRAVDEAIERCANRPEVLAISVGNEVPADVVRVHGIRAVENILSEFIERVHQADPSMLATYCNFPTTEFLSIAGQDLVCFNVFLEEPSSLRSYLRHLQVISGDVPLVMTELGLASEVHGEKGQAESLEWQLRLVDEVGCAGATVFSWTDDWAVAGEQVEGWGFGLTDAERRPKPALSVASRWARSSIEDLRKEWPRISVVVCAYNAAGHIDECLRSLAQSTYPNLEVIVCDDGSSDRTALIARRHPVKLLALDHVGLGAARNAGIQAAGGTIVAFLDSDAFCHPEWPFHLALAMEDPEVAATGGPNLPVGGVGFSERVVAESPGGPIHVLTDDHRAEHVPGCNMAFHKSALKEIGGFDPAYMAAGDDVDACWKLLDRGSQISFSPAAQVRHHRRETIRGYLKQQRGYGRAEKLVAARHRNRFNRLGQARWSGFIYGGPRMLPRLLRPVVYHGYLGQAPFQPVIARRSEALRMWSTALVPIVVAIALAGALAIPLWGASWPAAAAAGLALVLHFTAITRGVQPRRGERHPKLFRLTVAAMHTAQPLIRVIGRLGRVPRVRSQPEPTWDGDRSTWLRNLREALASKGCTVRVAEPESSWDLSVSAGPLSSARVTIAVLWSWTPSISISHRPRLLGYLLAIVGAVVMWLGSLQAGMLVMVLTAVGVLLENLALRRRLRSCLSYTTSGWLETNPNREVSAKRKKVRRRSITLSESFLWSLMVTIALLLGAAASALSLIGEPERADAVGGGVALVIALPIAIGFIRYRRANSPAALWEKPPEPVDHEAEASSSLAYNSVSSSAGRVLRRVLGHSRSFWFPIAGVFLLDLLATPLLLLMPIPLKLAVDSVVGNAPLPSFVDAVLPDFLTSSEWRLLLLVGALQVIVVLGNQLQELTRYVLSTYAGEKVTLSIRSKLFRHMQRLSLLFHEARGSTDSIYRVQYDAPSFQYIAVDALSLLLSSSFMLVAMIVVIASLNVQLALIALAVCPFLFLLSRSFGSKVRPRYKDLKGIETDAMNVVQEVLMALRLVKAFGREASEHQRFIHRSSEGARARVRLSFAEGAFGLWINLLTAAGTAGVLVIGIRIVQTGALTLGEFLVVVAYIAQLYSPLKMINSTFGAIQASLAGAERVFEVLDQAPEVTEKPTAVALKRAQGRIELRAVSFTYENRTHVLHDLWLAIEPGTKLGIVGPTGAGKTTLIGLIARFYDPDDGIILLDGVDLRDYKLTDLRNQFAIVLQEPVLFSTTIADNIAFGRPEASEEEIIAAAKAANAHEFIMALPDRYDTLVGERGLSLSGGERQRLSLARAFVKDAPILILDEPTSSVDLKTEQEIIQAMDRLAEGRTTFMIAHRAQTLQNCDALIKVDDGRLVIDAERASNRSVDHLVAASKEDVLGRLPRPVVAPSKEEAHA